MSPQDDVVDRAVAAIDESPTGRAWQVGVEVWDATGSLDHADTRMLVTLADYFEAQPDYRRAEHREVVILLRRCLANYARASRACVVVEHDMHRECAGHGLVDAL